MIPLDDVVALFDMAVDGSLDGGRAAELLGDERAAGRLRRLAVELRRWRRRERELAALFSSARELAELRDPDELLDRLVRRAHELMNTDVTYLSEFQEASGELLVRSTTGTVTPAIRRLRVPAGMGLASEVVRTRVPQWTASYEDAVELSHESGIDQAVRAEGLVSLLGVPMLADEEVLGVLFAANRSAHAFTPDEVALLSAFADHASVVLQTARLLRRARRSTEAAEGAYAELSRHAAAVERAGAVHQDLTAAVLAGGGAEEVAATLARALGRAVTILDRDLEVVAGGEAPTGLSEAVGAAVDASRRSGHCVLLPEGEVAAVAAAVAGGTLLGCLLVGPGGLPIGEVEQRTIERAAQITALLTLSQDAVADAEERVRGELLSDVLADSPARRRDAARRARARHVRLDDLRIGVVAVVAAEQRRPALRAAQGAALPHGLAGEHEGVLTVLLPGDDPEAAARHVHRRLGAAVKGGVLAVAAPVAEDPGLLAERCELARACARLLPALGTVDGAVTTDAYLPYTVLFGPDRRALERFIGRTLGPVLRWDRERNADLLATLRAYVEANGSPTRAARDLGVHTNTMLQRLERITALLGSGWRDPEPFFRLSVAVRLHALGDAARHG
nr:GAF domain-containing protein [Actinomadura rugatobispora]